MAINNNYKLTYSGLVSAISSSINEPARLLMLHILAYANRDRLMSEQLSRYIEKSGSQLESLMTSLIEDKYLTLTHSEDVPDQELIVSPEMFISQLETLSVNGKVILADAHGLILASSGYSASDAEYIAAIARNLVQISEQAKARIKNHTDKKLWSTGLSWGSLRALCLSIYVGRRQYILVVGGLPDLEKAEFFNLVGFLVRRYGYE